MNGEKLEIPSKEALSRVYPWIEANGVATHLHLGSDAGYVERVKMALAEVGLRPDCHSDVVVDWASEQNMLTWDRVFTREETDLVFRAAEIAQVTT